MNFPWQGQKRSLGSVVSLLQSSVEQMFLCGAAVAHARVLYDTLLDEICTHMLRLALVRGDEMRCAGQRNGAQGVVQSMVAEKNTTHRLVAPIACFSNPNSRTGAAIRDRRVGFRHSDLGRSGGRCGDPHLDRSLVLHYRALSDCR